MKYFIKKILISLLFFTPNIETYAQVLPIKFSSGIVYSDLNLGFSNYSITDQSYNTPKIGFYGSLGTGYQFSNWFQIQTNFNYQERLPLETFHFPRQSGSASLLVTVPTSPQSQNWDADIFNRLPNFKYLYFELTPMVNYSIKKINFSAGLGIYLGYLLNRGQLVFTGDDFPVYSNFFLPFSDTGSITYTKHDLGWMPKFEIFYALNSKTKIGISSQAYLSHTRLINDLTVSLTPEYDRTFFDWSRDYQTTWIAYTVGLAITHQFKY